MTRLTETTGAKRLLAGAVLLLAAAAGTQHFLVAQSAAPRAPLPPGQNPNGMRVYIWAGLKSHQLGQHDYPQFLADWSKLLTERGAVVDGSLHAPSSADLEHTDVVVIYKGDAGYPVENNKAALEAYVKRGGGFVNLHDSLCGPDPAYMATLLGGGKKHGEVNYTLDAPIEYSTVDHADPIMKDMTDFTILDEAFYKMTWSQDPAVHILASVKVPPTKSAGEPGEVAPQIWTYEHTLSAVTLARLRLDARPHLRQLLQLPDPANAAARHCVGRQETRRRTD